MSEYAIILQGKALIYPCLESAKISVKDLPEYMREQASIFPVVEKIVLTHSLKYLLEEREKELMKISEIKKN